jgi:hypothetical protein
MSRADLSLGSSQPGLSFWLLPLSSPLSASRRILKRGVIGVYHHVSQQHLHRYLAEFDFRHNNRVALDIDDIEPTEKTLQGIKRKR